MRALKYSDISLVPKYSECEQRSHCSTEALLGGKPFRLPIVPANMKAVVDEQQCHWLSKNHYFHIMHRFDIDVQAFIENANRESWPIISASLGVKPHDQQIVSNIKTSGARLDFLTLDIAHGHLSLMQRMIRYCKNKLPDTQIIAGNVATPQGVKDLAMWGADIVKVGIGQGSPCTTKDKTGFTLPMFTCVKECSQVFIGDSFEDSQRVPIIADGGIQCNGDIAKALVAGADWVMAGGLFACCVDSAAHSIMVEGSLHRAYYGSASFENKKTRAHIEGTLKNVPSCGLTFEDKLVEIKEDLQSAISYSGGKDLTSLNKSVQYRAV
mgnify:FL=1